MKKKYVIIIVVISLIIDAILIDTLQASLRDTSPVIKLREYLSDRNITYIDHGILVDHYHCDNGNSNTIYKDDKYTCNKDIAPLEQPIIQDDSDNYNDSLVSCIKSYLDSYILDNNDKPLNIPLSNIKKSNIDKIAYYNGTYASNNKDNEYFIVYPKDGTWDAYIMEDFDYYFYSKYPVYQNDTIGALEVYIHTKDNNIDFKEIENNCFVKDDIKYNEEALPNKTINKFSNTKRVDIKAGNEIIGSITNDSKVKRIINTVSTSKITLGVGYTCEGAGFKFELYDENNRLIDTVLIWGSGNRLMPESIDKGGCSSYHVTNGGDFRKIIEDETDYIFSGIITSVNSCEDNNIDEDDELIFEDKEYKYYLSCKKSDKERIKFELSNQIVNLKYAINNNYITIEQAYKQFSYAIIRRRS